MRRLLPFLLISALAPAARAHAQEPAAPAAVPANRVCRLSVDPNGVTSREGGLLYIHDPFRVICNDGANLRANSGVYDQAARVVTLSGDVYFEDQTRSLTSDEAVYNNAIGMLHATGNVVFADRVEGTSLVGPELEYYRANEQREEALVNAMGRPRLVLTRPPGGEADAGQAPDETPGENPAPGAQDDAGPMTIDADRLTIEGQDDLTAIGNVVIEDENMRAVADEAERRGSSETMELRGNAAIHSREYSLSAATIFATVPEGSIGDVEATGDARLLGEDLNVDAPRIDLFFANDLLQRSVARSDAALAPGVRPIAASPTFRLEADSIDASLPDQRLRTVVAVGDARGESIDTTRATPAEPDSAVLAAADTAGVRPDSLAMVALDTAGVPAAGTDSVAPAGVAARYESGDSVTTVSAVELVENDWITGDTITGFFASVAPGSPDSAALEGEDTVTAPVEPLTPLEGEGETAATASDTTLVMERLVAVGAARSLYHVAPEEGSPPGTRPGINFLSAAHIELRFGDGQVQVADVSGLRRGLYLEPMAARTEDEEAAVGAAEEAAAPDGGAEEEPSQVEPVEEPGSDDVEGPDEEIEP